MDQNTSNDPYDPRTHAPRTEPNDFYQPNKHHAEPAGEQASAPVADTGAADAAAEGDIAAPYVPPVADTGDDNVDELAGRERTDVENTDEAPLLADHAPGYDKTVEYPDQTLKDEVDLSDMPPLRSFEHELPSARFVKVAEGVDIIGRLPEDMLNQKKAEELADVDEDNFDMSKLSIVSALADVIPAMEDYVIGMAADPDLMRDWLIKRGDMNVVMAAFNLAQAHVKN